MKYIFDKDSLINLYNANDINCAKLSRILDINEKTEKKYLNKFGVDTSGHRHIDRYNFNYDYLLEQYEQCNRSSAKLAKRLGVSQPTVKRHLNLHGIDSSINIGNRKHFFNEHYFAVINSEKKAYWLGFILADGCIYRGSDKWSYRLQINLSIKDLNHLKMFLNNLGADYDIERYFSKEHDNINSTEIVTVKINSTPLCKDLLRIGVTPRKSMNEVFPTIPINLYNHLIRGYFDGDGTISHSKRSKTEWHFSILGGLSFLTELSSMLPVDSNIYFKHKSKTGDKLYNLAINKAKSILLIYDYLYSNSSIYLYRKKSIYDNFKTLIDNA